MWRDAAPPVWGGLRRSLDVQSRRTHTVCPRIRHASVSLALVALSRSVGAPVENSQTYWYDWDLTNDKQR